MVVLLIIDSNRKEVERKLFTNSQKQTGMQQQGEIPPNHPDLAAMEHIKELEDQLKNDPHNGELMVHLANSYFDIGRFDRAIAFYKKAIAHKMSTPEVLIDLGVSYFNISKMDSALIFVDEALKIKPDHRLALLNKGVIEFNLGRYNAAINSWQKLIQLHPGTKEATNAKEFIKEAKKRLQ